MSHWAVVYPALLSLLIISCQSTTNDVAQSAVDRWGAEFRFPRGDELKQWDARYSTGEHWSGVIERPTTLSRGLLYNGRKTGSWESIDDDRRPFDAISFMGGVEHGAYVEFDWWGRPRAVSVMFRGVREGQAHEFGERGELLSEGLYAQGRPIGTWRRFNWGKNVLLSEIYGPGGAIQARSASTIPGDRYGWLSSAACPEFVLGSSVTRSREEWCNIAEGADQDWSQGETSDIVDRESLDFIGGTIDGSKEGVWICLGPRGLVRGVRNYRFDVLHGFEIVWHTNGRPRLLRRYHNGILHGPCFEWSDCADLVLEGAYRDGRAVGQWRTILWESGHVRVTDYMEGRVDGGLANVREWREALPDFKSMDPRSRVTTVAPK